MLRSVAMKETLTPLAQCPRETLAAIEGVLTDIDETVSTHSQRGGLWRHGSAEKGRIPRDP